MKPNFIRIVAVCAVITGLLALFHREVVPRREMMRLRRARREGAEAGARAILRAVRGD